MLERRKQELDLVRAKYGEIEVGPNLEWLWIKRYPLSAGLSKLATTLLILIPPGYPTTPPDNFYADNDLRLADGRLPANASPNQQHLGQPWLQFSYHVEPATWQPHANLLEGHNLLTFLLGVESRLAEAD